ncbi:uncharacterized protein LOC131988654 isoform X3 [Centropristis striata]|uniref:uncharacterized protein LOC131988654 isoform X3 n=1 Tax=Centropristis striata TaxID=184440 RepID=UPI0027DF5EAE|nr:uncharacterized protein LOC131988654 isoform X3 [Centropristis striata]
MEAELLESDSEQHNRPESPVSRGIMESDLSDSDSEQQQTLKLPRVSESDLSESEMSTASGDFSDSGVSFKSDRSMDGGLYFRKRSAFLSSEQQQTLKLPRINESDFSDSEMSTASADFSDSGVSFRSDNSMDGGLYFEKSLFLISELMQRPKLPRISESEMSESEPSSFIHANMDPDDPVADDDCVESDDLKNNNRTQDLY